MIAKISSNPSFSVAVDYAARVKYGCKDAYILMHSDGIMGDDPSFIASLLQAYSQKGHHDCKKPARHFSLSFSPQDTPRMTDDFMRQIASEYMHEMGIRDTEFVVYRHSNRKHPHFHIVFSRIDRNGRTISDSCERKRNAKVCKHITAKYGLTFGKGKKNVNRDSLRGKEAVRYAMFDKVSAAYDSATHWGEFRKALEKAGIEMRLRYNSATGKVMGVAFADDKAKASFSGKKLAPYLTLPSLSKKFGSLPELARESVKHHYDTERERLLEINRLDYEACDSIEKAFIDFDERYPKDTPMKLPDIGLDTFHLKEGERIDDSKYRPTTDTKTAFISLGTLCGLLLASYGDAMTLSSGGGGGTSSDLKWRDDDDDRKRQSFRFFFKTPKQSIQTKPNRSRRR